MMPLIARVYIVNFQKPYLLKIADYTEMTIIIACTTIDNNMFYDFVTVFLIGWAIQPRALSDLTIRGAQVIVMVALIGRVNL